MTDLASDLIQRADKLKADRSNFDSQWQEIADLMRPGRAEFTREREPGEKRMQQIFDGTPLASIENFASGMWGMATSSSTDWFALRHPDDDMQKVEAVAKWMEDATARMRRIFAANGGRFYTAAHDLYADLAAFGTGVFFCEGRDRAGVFFTCRHLAECYAAENEDEQIDTMFRRFRYTARQAVLRWKDKVSNNVKSAAERSPDQKFSFLHAVFPRADYDHRALDQRRLPWRSVYVEIDGKKELSEGGYEEFPYQVPRWSTNSRGLYGDAPAMLALPDVKSLNTSVKTQLSAAQKSLDPPLLAADEQRIRGIKTHPGSIIYGAVDAQGRALVQTLQNGTNWRAEIEVEERMRQAIREAFFFSLMQMAQKPNMTATEVMAMQEEKMRLLGPHLGRLHAEFLDPLVTRVFNIAARSQMLPPLPPELAEAPDFRVEYISPLARAQKTGESQAILRFMQPVMQMIPAAPDIVDNVDMDETARRLADGYSVPTAIMRDPKKVKSLREERAKAQAQQAMMAQAQPMAETADSLASAEKQRAEAEAMQGQAA